MPANLSNVQIQDPAVLFDQMLRANLPTSQFYGLANTFRVPVERDYGTGSILIGKADFDKLAAVDKNAMTLTFTEERGNNTVTFVRLKLLSSTNILPSDDTAASSVLLLKLVDRRFQYRQVPAGQRYNWLQSNNTYDPPSLSSGSLYTWQTLVNHLWAKLRVVYPDLPTFGPQFPTTPGSTPQGFDFIDDDCWVAMCRVAQAAGFLIQYDPTTDITSIINPATTVTETEAARYSRNWDAASRVTIAGRNPQSIRVVFNRFNRGDEHVITVANPSARSPVVGTVEIIASDLPAVGNPVSNVAVLNARAVALAAQAGRDFNAEAEPRNPVDYHGYQNWARLAAGYSNYVEWAVYDRGNGLKTSLMSGPLLVSGIEDFNDDLVASGSGSGSGSGACDGLTLRVLVDSCPTFSGSGSGRTQTGQQNKYATLCLPVGTRILSTECGPVVECPTSFCDSGSGSGSGGGGGGGGSPAQGGTASCCSRTLNATLFVVVSGVGTITLTWNGTRWEGNGALTGACAGTQAYFRYDTSCNLFSSCDGTTFALVPSLGTTVICTPLFSVTDYSVSYNNGIGGCSFAGCGIRTATIGE